MPWRTGGEDTQRPAMSLDGLSKRFGTRTAFEGLSFEVAQGEVFGLLGPNGAGKTTTVRTLGTLLAPSAGSATVAGLSLLPQNSGRIRSRIAIMPESPGLYGRLSVTETLGYFAGLYGVIDPVRRIAEVLGTVSLTDRAADLCGALSKGQRQRVSLARALLNDPQVLFLDEPTSGLDPVAAHDVHRLLDELRGRGVTVILTTHRLEEAERLCDRVAILDTTLQVIGRPRQLREQLFARTMRVAVQQPIHLPDAVFAGLPGVQAWRDDGPGDYLLTVMDPAIAAPAVTRALVAAGADVLSIGEVPHTLEDGYLRLLDPSHSRADERMPGRRSR